MKIKNKSKKHLSLEDRRFIDVLLRENYKLKDIALQLGRPSSTISREIKKNRVGTNIQKPVCEKTERFPFVCTNCKKKSYCNCNKYHYNPSKAHENYLHRLSGTRRGIDMDIDEVEYWNEVLRKRIKEQGQPTLHMFKNIDFPKCLSTFYSYIERGIFPSVNSEMMPRMYSFKPRRKKNEKTVYIHEGSPIRKDRSYKDYQNFIKENSDTNIVFMDTVVGKRDDLSCLLTLLFNNNRTMLIYKIKHYSPEAVVEVFQKLVKDLGIENFKKLFGCILTDGGWEFSKSKEIEADQETGEILTKVFFCDSGKAWQKGKLERNHEFIRYIIPKGISFDTLTKKNVIDMMNHINNVERETLNGQSPYKLFIEEHNPKIASSLNLKYIPEGDVNLTYNILK